MSKLPTEELDALQFGSVLHQRPSTETAMRAEHLRVRDALDKMTMERNRFRAALLDMRRFAESHQRDDATAGYAIEMIDKALQV